MINPTIIYNTTTQHSTALHIGKDLVACTELIVLQTIPTITAQDGQFATTIATDSAKGQFGFSPVLAGLVQEPKTVVQVLNL